MADRPFDITDVKAKAIIRAFQWTEGIQQTTVRLHETAPRGGENENVWGQKRSAPGEVPALEFGNLRDAIEDGITTLSNGYEVIVNRESLEFGEEGVLPRPMGRIVLELAKAHARSRGDPEAFR